MVHSQGQRCGLLRLRLRCPVWHCHSPACRSSALRVEPPPAAAHLLNLLCNRHMCLPQAAAAFGKFDKFSVRANATSREVIAGATRLPALHVARWGPALQANDRPRCTATAGCMLLPLRPEARFPPPPGLKRAPAPPFSALDL